MAEPYCHAFFCDQVLEQTNGKFSYIGCYGTHMFLQEFPANLSLALVLTFAIAPPEDELSIDFTIWKSGEKLMESNGRLVPEGEPPEGLDLARFNQIVELGLENIEEDSVLSATVIIDGIKLESPTLTITKFPESPAVE